MKPQQDDAIRHSTPSNHCVEIVMQLNTLFGLSALLFLLLCSFLHAQRVDTIRANPDAVELRKIWQVTGGEFGGGRVGDGIGSVGDINSDGLEDWAVHYGDASEWHIFNGSTDSVLSTEPVVILDSLGAVPAYPIVGDFWGTGHKAIGFPRGESEVVNGTTVYYYFLPIYRTDSNRLDSVPAVEFAPSRMTPPTAISASVTFQAADLDNDGADELVLITRGVGRGSTLIGRYPEVWIFRGGENFQVDTPTVILRDSEYNGGRSSQSMIIADADGDGRLDLITGSDYADGTQKQKFFFSNSGSPWNWSEPDRVVVMSNFVPFDGDGDGLLDMATGGIDYTVSLLLSSSGKDVRTRSFSSNDVDRRYRAPSYYCYPFHAGYISDSARGYESLNMLIAGGDYFFSGGPSGPDGDYDAYGSIPGARRPLGDVTGDGWDDLIGGTYDVNFNSGIAAIYAGGPYIPRDPSLGVRHVATHERSDAVSVWPNPATTELHIAWRGDLTRMPRRFEIHDLPGRLIARGEVESWRGEALWQCDGAPAGVYLLSIMDYRGEPIATTRIIKQ